MVVPAALRLAVILLKLIVGYLLLALNEYHKSAPVVPAQVLAIAGFDGLALCKSPDVVVQVVLEFKLIAPVHSSLAGGS